LKLRSVTQRRPSGEVLDATRRELLRGGLRVRATVELAPFAREHAAILVEAEAQRSPFPERPRPM
jgi:fibrillarin-like rRNA methylase